MDNTNEAFDDFLDESIPDAERTNCRSNQDLDLVIQKLISLGEDQIMKESIMHNF